MDFDNEEDLKMYRIYKQRKTQGKINFNMIMKCYDLCVNNFRSKRLDPREKECMIPCMKNLFAVSLEINNCFSRRKENRS